MEISAQQQHPYVRGPRVDYTWSALFLFERPHSFEEVVVHKLGSIVMEYADPEWPINGAVLGSGDAADRTTLVLGLDPDPEWNHGTPDQDRCERIAAKITNTLGWQRQPENLPEMRIILGRRIGYEGPAYSMEETRSIADTHGGSTLKLIEADLFSLRYVQGLREYHEPGVIVECPAADLPAVLQTAAAMGQERLVTEITGSETQVWE
jgi:hypothetical protein